MLKTKASRRLVRLSVGAGFYFAFLITCVAGPHMELAKAISLFLSLGAAVTALVASGILLWQWSEEWIKRGEGE